QGDLMHGRLELCDDHLGLIAELERVAVEQAEDASRGAPGAQRVPGADDKPMGHRTPGSAGAMMLEGPLHRMQRQARAILRCKDEAMHAEESGEEGQGDAQNAKGIKLHVTRGESSRRAPVSSK